MLQSLTSRQKNGKSVHTLQPGQSTHHTHTHARCYLPQSKGGTIKDLKKKGDEQMWKNGWWMAKSRVTMFVFFVHLCHFNPKGFKTNKNLILQFTIYNNSNNNQKGENLHWNAQDSFFPHFVFFRSHTKKGCRSESTFTLAKVYKCTIIQLEVCIHY